MRINSLVDTAELAKEKATLPPEESHHLARVLRVMPGQEVILFDGRGGVAEAVVDTISKTAVEVRIVRRQTVPPPAAAIHLIQAVPKPDRWEWVLQKAVELGAASIQPVLTSHTEFRPNPKKEERWRRIILNAAQQCEVRWLPELRPVQTFEAVLAGLAEYDRILIGSLYEEAGPFRGVDLTGIKRIALLIGPEGDFTREEVAAAVAAGAVPVSFGDRILRTETAAIFGLSVLVYKLL
jgi:16S rRNA (uracil1498-N3)-methyltransferase